MTKNVTGLRKHRNKNHWTLPYAYAGRRSEVHVWLVEDKDSPYFGKYHVCCGAASDMADTFDVTRHFMVDGKSILFSAV